MISVNMPCFIILREENDVTVAVSNPKPRKMSLQVKLSLRLSGYDAQYDPTNDATTLTFKLPRGQLSGKTILKSFTRE